MSKRNISATIDETLLERLDQVAAKTERKKSWLISKALESFLATLEKLEWYELPREKRSNVDSVAQRLFESERLYEEAKELNPLKIKPLVRSFDSFEEYERWRSAQEDPWYK